MNPYPYLDSLLGAWFHQDFDIEGDVSDIIPKFVASSHAVDVWATVADIRRFLQDHADDTEAAFTAVFGLTIEPSGWGMTAREWLVWVERLIVEHAPKLPE